MVTAPILAKRYGRSRLYDTERGQHVTLADLRGRERRGITFVGVDTESGEDVTRVLLA